MRWRPATRRQLIALLDDDFTWVDSNGRLLSRQDVANSFATVHR